VALNIIFRQWFSPDTPVLSTNKTDRYDISKILLKVALNTIILTPMGWLSESKQFGQLISKLEYLPTPITIPRIIKYTPIYISDSIT
jgi:hypothetical protein